jgi:hypothetical protein
MLFKQFGKERLSGAGWYSFIKISSRKAQFSVKTIPILLKPG